MGEGPRASERETDRLTDQSWERGERRPEPCTSRSLPALSFPLLWDFLKPCLFPGLPAIVHVSTHPCGVYGPCVCCVCSSACDVLYGVVFVRYGGCGVCGVVCGMLCVMCCMVWYMCVCGMVCVTCDVCCMCGVVCVVWCVFCFMCVVRCGICVCVVWCVWCVCGVCVVCVMCDVCVVWYVWCGMCVCVVCVVWCYV